MIIEGRKYHHIMPEQMKQIVSSLVDHHADPNGNLNLEQFKKFLGENPVLKKIVQLSLKPTLWTLNEKQYAQFHMEEVTYDIEEAGGSSLKNSTLDNSSNGK